jgi:hypothetical protein
VARSTKKRGPRKQQRRRSLISTFWQHCEKCRTHTATYANWQTAMRAVPLLGGDRALGCINRFGGIHLAVA